MEYTLKIYETRAGEEPLTRWLNDLKDQKARIAIRMRLYHARQGFAHLDLLRLRQIDPPPHPAHLGQGLVGRTLRCRFGLVSPSPNAQNLAARGIDRMKLGNFGYCESVGDGVSEMKVDLGPGYRVYFGMIGKTIVLLLCGGNKKTQDKDIRKALEFFKDHKQRENRDA